MDFQNAVASDAPGRVREDNRINVHVRRVSDDDLWCNQEGGVGSRDLRRSRIVVHFERVAPSDWNCGNDQRDVNEVVMVHRAVTTTGTRWRLGTFDFKKRPIRRSD